MGLNPGPCMYLKLSITNWALIYYPTTSFMHDPAVFLATVRRWLLISEDILLYAAFLITTGWLKHVGGDVPDIPYLLPKACRWQCNGKVLEHTLWKLHQGVHQLLAKVSLSSWQSRKHAWSVLCACTHAAIIQRQLSVATLTGQEVLT